MSATPPSVFHSRLKTHLFSCCYPWLHPPQLLLCLRSDTVIVGHINLSCYLLTHFYCANRSTVALSNVQKCHNRGSCLQRPNSQLHRKINQQQLQQTDELRGAGMIKYTSHRKKKCYCRENRQSMLQIMWRDECQQTNYIRDTCCCVGLCNAISQSTEDCLLILRVLDWIFLKHFVGVRLEVVHQRLTDSNNTD